MDMQVGLPTRCIGWCNGSPASEYIRLAEHRSQVSVLIGEFRQAVVQPRGRRDAIRILKEMLVRLDIYFGVIESLLDKISAVGAAPHRSDHRRILNELKSTLARCSDSASERPNADLVHALDALVMHEAAIRLRTRERTSSSLSTSVEAALPL
jgi:hypothetical protein